MRSLVHRVPAIKTSEDGISPSILSQFLFCFVVVEVWMAGVADGGGPIHRRGEQG
jgi:hypothetical protein